MHACQSGLMKMLALAAEFMLKWKNNSVFHSYICKAEQISGITWEGRCKSEQVAGRMKQRV